MVVSVRPGTATFLTYMPKSYGYCRYLSSISPSPTARRICGEKNPVKCRTGSTRDKTSFVTASVTDLNRFDPNRPPDDLLLPPEPPVLIPIFCGNSTLNKFVRPRSSFNTAARNLSMSIVISVFFHLPRLYVQSNACRFCRGIVVLVGKQCLPIGLD
ncbi:hypothetical protein D3C71_1645980 [compost metagenome]